MYCPKCGTQNAQGSDFCSGCGKSLTSVRSVAPPITRPDAPLGAVSPPNVQLRNLAAFTITASGIACAIGGLAIVIGWFVPWFGLSGLLGLIGRAAGTALAGRAGGSVLEELFGGSLSLRSASVGNGIQVALGGLGASFTLLDAGGSAGGIGFLLLLADAAFIAIPFMGAACIRHGLRLAMKALPYYARRAKANAASVLVILACLFFLFAVVPLGLSLLGGGFYWTVLGAVIALLSALYAHNELGTEAGDDY